MNPCLEEHEPCAFRSSFFGAFRQFQEHDTLDLNCPGAATVADVRSAMDAYARAHWLGYAAGLLQTSAFASEAELLRSTSPIPDDGRLAIIPPVSGG